MEEGTLTEGLPVSHSAERFFFFFKLVIDVGWLSPL